MATYQEYTLPLALRTVNGPLEIDGAWGDCISCLAALRVTGNQGTTPTLDVSIATTVDGTNWDTLMTFTQVTTSTANQRLFKSLTESTPIHFGRRMRINWTIGGTATPGFTFTVIVTGKGL